MKMKVTRPFLLAGVRQEIDTKIEIDDSSMVALLKHEGKAIPINAIATGGPMTTQTASGVVAGGKDKPAKPAKQIED